MKILNLDQLSPQEIDKLTLRSQLTLSPFLAQVNQIISDVKDNGDRALFKYSRLYDKSQIRSLRVSKQEIRQAYLRVDPDFISAIKQAANNIRQVQLSQLPEPEKAISTQKGIKVWRKWTPIDKVGLYIPGGRAVYPSTVLMAGIPAKIAGCKEIILCSPPDTSRLISPYVLVAADLIGIDKIYKLGGAQAVAAMAFGTQTIPKVSKIFGPGNSWVTTAKLALSGQIAIDLPAGPSEVFILADDTANPAWIAADLLADGEHGSDSACVLATTSNLIADKTMAEIRRQLAVLPTSKRATESLDKYGLIITAKSIRTLINFCNNYAPEHLELMVRKPKTVLNRITNAGSIFLGPWTCKSSGDYATGANHVLPTSGAAKMYSALGIDSFGKWTEVQQCSRLGLKLIKKSIEKMANVEQLPGHRKSVSIRFTKL